MFYYLTYFSPKVNRAPVIYGSEQRLFIYGQGALSPGQSFVVLAIRTSVTSGEIELYCAIRISVIITN